ncbi:MAG: glycosyltransferase, partial [Terriglobales bacterium]
VTGPAISRPGRANWIQKRFDACWRGFCRPFPYLATPERVGGILQRALVGVGANMAFRRNALLQLNGFPNRLTGDAADDNYIFYRTLSAGWKIQYMPDSIIYEEHRSGLGEVLWRWFQYGSANVQVMAEIAFEEGNYSSFFRNVLWTTCTLPFGWLYAALKRKDTFAGLAFQLVSVLFLVGMAWQFPFSLWRLWRDLARRSHGQVPEQKELGG